jgi:hypothetical protein
VVPEVGKKSGIAETAEITELGDTRSDLNLAVKLEQGVGILNHGKH